MKIKHDIVIFDIDSTLVTIEGLDWLAENLGVGNKIKNITDQAMNGVLPMEQAMQFKMSILRPTRAEMRLLGEKYIESLVPNVPNVINFLQNLGKELWLISGNFSPAVNILGNHLKIPSSNIICNQIFFDKNGNYLKFDLGNPLGKNGGKKVIIQRLFDKRAKKIAFIGDGYTDLEAAEAVDTFVGFGGVVAREKVMKACKNYVKTNDMRAILPHILTKEEIVLR